MVVPFGRPPHLRHEVATQQSGTRPGNGWLGHSRRVDAWVWVCAYNCAFGCKPEIHILLTAAHSTLSLTREVPVCQGDGDGVKGV